MAIALPGSFLARKSKSLGNEQSGLSGNSSQSILRTRKMGENRIVFGWGFRLRGFEREHGDKAGCQRLCALAKRLKFINNYFQAPGLCVHDFI